MSEIVKPSPYGGRHRWVYPSRQFSPSIDKPARCSNCGATWWYGSRPAKNSNRMIRPAVHDYGKGPTEKHEPCLSFDGDARGRRSGGAEGGEMLDLEGIRARAK